MMLRLFVLLFLAGSAMAEWRLSLLAPGGERAVGETCDLGSTDVGLELIAAFRLRNIGTTSAATGTLSIQGADFSLVGATPATIDAGGVMDFRVRFRPRSAGAFSAGLLGPHGSTIVRAAAVAAPVVRDSAGLALGAAAGLEWGAIAIGMPQARRVLIENATGYPLAVPGVAVSGADFTVSGTIPVELGPLQSAPIEVIFTPAAAGERTGTLTVGTRTVPLRGYGVEPPPPALRLLADAVVRSGEQHVVRVRLDEPARRALRGEVVIESASADATLLFASGARSVTFELPPGGQERSFPYQTGTTAGAIRFRARMGDQVIEATVQALEQPIRIVAARGAREANSVLVQGTAIDNTLSTSVLSYIFLDREGKELGRWSRDYAEIFSQHFRTSTLGGAYSLAMRFPVTGDVTRVHAVEVEMTNRLGVTRSDRIAF